MKTGRGLEPGYDSHVDSTRKEWVLFTSAAVLPIYFINDKYEESWNRTHGHTWWKGIWNAFTGTSSPSSSSSHPSFATRLADGLHELKRKAVLCHQRLLHEKITVDAALQAVTRKREREKEGSKEEPIVVDE